MAHTPSHNDVPTELVDRHAHGWMCFTKATLYGCLAVAAVLLLMLAFLR